jgi:hypothetical protein
MDVQSRIFADCVLDHKSRHVDVDYQSLIERIILFDTYILESARLKEIRQIVTTFGYGPTIELLKSGLLEISCDSIAICCPTSITSGPDNREIRAHPYGTYSFGIAKINEQRHFVSSGMTDFLNIPKLKHKEFIKLKGSVSGILHPRLDDTGNKALQQMRLDIKNNNLVLKLAIKSLLDDKLDANIDIHAIHIAMHEEKEGVFRAESNLCKDYKLSEVDAHKVVEGALMALSNLEQSLEYMELYSAISIFRDNELSFFDNKLSFLLAQLNPEWQINRFRRVSELGGFPDLREACAAGIVRLDKVIEIAKSDECKIFREWLRTSDKYSDSELEDAFGNIRAKLFRLSRGNTGKTIRWSLNTGVGMVPIVGPIIGPAFGLIDTFILEKLLPKPGPINFLQSGYRSIFDQ